MLVQVPSIAKMSHIDQCWEDLSSSKKEPVGKGRPFNNGPKRSQINSSKPLPGVLKNDRAVFHP
jgi:hypothetical protein